MRRAMAVGASALHIRGQARGYNEHPREGTLAMRLRKSVLIGLGLIGACATAASAEFFIGQPIVIENALMQNFSVHYYSSTTPYDGVLWLEGRESRDEPDRPLFFNHDGGLGFEHYIGRWEIGDRLDFLYDVLTGHPDSFRMRDEQEIFQFGWEWSTPDIILVGVDDVRLPNGDADYDDILFEVRFGDGVPAPGAACGAAMLGLFAVRRRRN